MSERIAPTPRQKNDAARNASTKSAHTRGSSSDEFTTKPMPVSRRRLSVQRSRRRRSTASAIEPPTRVSVSSGTSSTKLTSPTISVDPVSW